MRKLVIGSIVIGAGEPLALIAGPCVIESRESTLAAAEILLQICERVGVPLIFKSSFDKANRLSLNSFRGPGLAKGLEILQEVKDRFQIPVTTDLHAPEQAQPVAQVCDLLQIPAFLCRQTDLLVAAARTGKPLSIKKGQFMAPQNMGSIVEKVRASGNEQIMLIDRGTCFGYNNLISDMRAIPIMQESGNCPVCFDATHAVQLPGGQGTHSGGERQYVPTLSYAAMGAGANALFIEAHADPSRALSDAATMLSFEQFEEVVTMSNRIHEVVTCSNVPC